MQSTPTNNTSAAAPIPIYSRSHLSKDTLVPLPSPPKDSARPSHRPSTSTSSMQWLSRSVTSASGPPKHSMHKRMRTIDNTSSHTGILGQGATVVRTPGEALRETGVRVTYEANPSSSSAPKKHSRSSSRAHPSPVPLTRTSSQSSTSTRVDAPISPPTSPPLPPLPLPEGEEEKPEEEDQDHSETARVSKPPRSPLLAPPMTSRTPSRSSLKSRSTASIVTTSDSEIPTVPPLPAHIAVATGPPRFTAILVSEPPAPIDPSKIIVALETCTATHKTTLQTLNARPSHLSRYLTSIQRKPARSTSPSAASSVYSIQSDDLALYRDHLTSQGLLPASSSVHLFLDRPSAPYHHIMNYLRMPLIQGQVETLPRSLRISSATSGSSSQPTSSYLEALIEVREEAAFLGLDQLQRLCADEIKIRYAPPRMHGRGTSTSSIHGINNNNSSTAGTGASGQIRTSGVGLHTLAERAEFDSPPTMLSVPSPSPTPAASSFPSTSPSQPPSSSPNPDSKSGNNSPVPPSASLASQGRLSSSSGSGVDGLVTKGKIVAQLSQDPLVAASDKDQRPPLTHRHRSMNSLTAPPPGWI